MEKITFKASKGNLLDCLLKISKVVKDKAPLPVYTYFLFEVSDGRLTITGTDMNVQISSNVDISEVSADMGFCVDKSIVDILKTLPEQPLGIKAVKEEIPELKTIRVSVDITHSSGGVTLNGHNPEHFSKMKNVDGKSFEIKALNLKRGLDKTRKFACTDTQKPTVSSVFFDIKPESLVFVASDNRIVSRFTDYSVKSQVAEPFILDLASASILSSLLTGFNDEIVTVATNAQNVSFGISDITFTSRLTEGRYLNYNPVFRQDLPIEIKMNSKQLSSTLSRLTTTADTLSSLIRLESGVIQTFLWAEDKACNKSGAESIESETTGDIVVGMHGRMLQDILSVIDGDVVFSFADASTPIQLSPAEQDDETDLTILMMPLSLN